jgi:hypothetical protein
MDTKVDTKKRVLWTPQWTPKPDFFGHQDGHQAAKLLRTKEMVPKKGLEPPHPCEYMDLNHARLPIPPLRHWDAPDNKCGAMKGAT